MTYTYVPILADGVAPLWCVIDDTICRRPGMKDKEIAAACERTNGRQANFAEMASFELVKTLVDEHAAKREAAK